ncbi:MAG TPA: translation elongation factor Ts [bacterium]|jgi:elongation factor Ts|nr:translation elongation factor Ts [bacterium]
MSAITAEMVKNLREKSGAGMMECKKALEANAGDMDASMKWLREKGIASAEKKAGRAAAEGLAGLKISGTHGVIVEVNCETDFVARTPQFLGLLDAATAVASGAQGLPDDAAAAAQTVAALKASDGRSLEEHVKSTIGALGENMALARVVHLGVKQGVLGSYRHSDGKLASLVALECGQAGSALKPEVLELAKDLAMQVAGNLPPAEVVSRDQISPALVAREREIALVQAAQAGAGKPAAIVEKIAEGKVNKVLQELTLLEQAFIKDTGVKIGDLVKQVGLKVGDTLTVGGFVRIKVGVK